MNLVSLLIAPAVVGMSTLSANPNPLRYLIAGIAVAVIIAAVVISTRRPVAIADTPETSDTQPAIASQTPVGEAVEERVPEDLKQPEPKPIK
jgi:K(+)-stimulated pyrophosphate-energized sodium pump